MLPSKNFQQAISLTKHIGVFQIVLIIATALSASSLSDKYNQKIDTSICFYYDLTRNGIADTSVLLILGNSLFDTIHLSFFVKAKGKVIYTYSQDYSPGNDSIPLDSMYLELSDSIYPCKSAFECKWMYFFNYLQKYIIRSQLSYRDGEPLGNLFEFSFADWTKSYIADSLHSDSLHLIAKCRKS